MKIILLLLPLALLSGCATANQKNAGAFLSKVSSMDIAAADIRQSTSGPFYSHTESLSGFHHAPGSFSIENLNATFAIPLWGVKWDFSASAIIGTTPQAIAAVAAAASSK